MVADRHHGATGAAAQQVPADDEQWGSPYETEEIEPLVAVERQPSRRVRLADDDALHAAGPRLQMLVFENLGRRDRKRERRERKIMSFEPQGRPAEQKPGDEANQAGERDRRRVGADRVERAVPERDLAVEARQHVEAEQDDGIDQDLRRLEQVVAAEREGQHAGRCQQRGNAGDPPGAQTQAGIVSGGSGAGGLDGDHDHTRVTSTRPNRPEGLTRSTPMMITSATVSFSSVPTT